MANGNDTDLTQDDMADDTGGDSQDSQDPTFWSSRGELEGSQLGGVLGGMLTGQSPQSPTSTMTGQPMEVPRQAGTGNLEQTMGVGMGGGPPAGTAIAARHGGLLTGLAGVLLDGLAGGLAPDRQTALMFPMRQQQAAAQTREANARATLDEQKANEEAQLAPLRMKLADFQTRFQLMQMNHVMQDMTAQSRLGINQFQAGIVEKAVQENKAEMVTRGTPEEISKYESDHAKDPEAMSLMPLATKWDDQGNPTEAALYRIRPGGWNDAINSTIPMTDVNGNTVEMKVHADAGPLEIQKSEIVGQIANFTKARGQSLKDGERNMVVSEPDPQRPGAFTQKIMSEADAQREEQQRGLKPGQLSRYELKPTDVPRVQSIVDGWNGVQDSFNTMAKINFNNVQPGLAAALIEQDSRAASASILGVHLQAPARFLANQRAENMKLANQDTRDYVEAYLVGAEQIRGLPRLQTLGKMNRVQTPQAEAAMQQFPVPGDDEAMARQKMVGLQRNLEFYKTGTPQGDMVNKLLPSWLEDQGISGDQWRGQASTGKTAQDPTGAGPGSAEDQTGAGAAAKALVKTVGEVGETVGVGPGKGVSDFFNDVAQKGFDQAAADLIKKGGDTAAATIKQGLAKLWDAASPSGSLAQVGKRMRAGDPNPFSEPAEAKTAAPRTAPSEVKAAAPAAPSVPKVTGRLADLPPDAEVNSPMAPGAKMPIKELRQIGISDAEIQRMIDDYGLAKK